jgi:nucleoside phosphorylase
MSDTGHHEDFTVGIICPLGIELRSCRKILELKDVRHYGKKKIYSGYRFGYSLNAVKGGLGGTKSSASTMHFIDSIGARLIIVAGTAGSLTENGRIGDVVVLRRAIPYGIQQDSDTASITDGIPERTVIDMLDETDLKRFHDFMVSIGSILNTTIRITDTASGMATVKDPMLRNRLHETTGAEICDWETADILKTARQSGIACLAFRVITDMADRHTLWDFTRNYGRVLNGLFVFLKQFIIHGGMDYIGNHQRHEKPGF